MSLTIDDVYRDWNTPSVPSSGFHRPVLSEIRRLHKQIEGRTASGIVTRNTKSALDLVSPASESFGGRVLDDADPTKNGEYYRASGAWVKGRSFPDTAAELVDVAGSANIVTAVPGEGIDPATVQVWFIEPLLTNTTDVVLNGLPVRNVNGDELAAGEWPAGRLILLTNRTTEWRLLSDPDADGAAAAAASSAAEAEVEADRAETARAAAELAAGGAAGLFNKLPEEPFATNIALTTAHAGKVMAFTTSTELTATLPDLAGILDQNFFLLNLGPSNLVIEPDPDDLVDGDTSLTMTPDSFVQLWAGNAGDTWRAKLYSADGNLLQASENLADLSDVEEARENLGVEWVDFPRDVLSSVGSWSKNGLGDYRELLIEGHLRPATDAVSMRMRFSRNDGASFDSSNGYHFARVYGVAGGGAAFDGTNPASSIDIGMSGSIGNDGGEGCHFQIRIWNFNQATVARVQATATTISSTGGYAIGTVGGLHGGSGDPRDAVQLAFSSGNIAEGSVTVRARK